MKKIIVSISLLWSCSVFAVEQSDTSQGMIEDIGIKNSVKTVNKRRSEESIGLVKLPTGITTSKGYCSRVWMNLKTPNGRTTYNTLLTAFSEGQTVRIRVNTTGRRIHSEAACQISDLYVSNKAKLKTL